MSTKLNINQISQYLPHRYPFLLVDAVDDVIPGETIEAHKCVTANEEMFNGHFPDNPVMPGVLQIEAMAQTAALLALMSGAKLDDTTSIYITGVTDGKFKRPIVPGDVMTLRAKVLKHKMGIWKFECTTHVGADLASQATLTATTAPKVAPPPIPAHLPKPPFAR
jgi:3-hydroxyacyl-[acyl-carrier-protein] dehydratase